MSTEDAFLDALLADPSDFETRLIFADWLEERGDPRGEFLRVQTELARWVPDHRRRKELRDDTFGELLFSPYLERLTQLNLANSRPQGPPRSLAVLCNSPVFKRLRWLDLRNMGLASEISHLLVTLEHSQLQWLDLHGN